MCSKFFQIVILSIFPDIFGLLLIDMMFAKWEQIANIEEQYKTKQNNKKTSTVCRHLIQRHTGQEPQG